MRQLQRPQLTQRGKLALRPLPSSTSCSSCKTKILEKKIQKITPAPQREDLRTELNELFDTADVQPQLQQGTGESQSIDVCLWKLMISLLQTDRGQCTLLKNLSALINELTGQARQPPGMSRPHDLLPGLTPAQARRTYPRPLVDRQIVLPNLLCNQPFSTSRSV